MPTHDITAQNFQAAVEKPGTLLLDWWAAWCGPCRHFGPIFEAVAEENPDFTFGKVDTDAQQELAAAFEVRSIPTLMVFRDGILLFSQPGALPKEALQELVAKVRALDMDDIRRQLEERKKAAPPEA